MGFWRDDGSCAKERIRTWVKGRAWLWGLLTGLLFIGIGVLEGQFSVVWKKAVMICMECIGIG